MSDLKIEPLSFLKDYFTNNKNIVEKDNMLIFSKTIKLNMNTPTAWQPPGSSKNYKLGDLWLYLDCKRKNLKHEYYKRISDYRNKIQIQPISFQHQDEIEKYFFGSLKNSECINENLRDVVKIEKNKKAVKKFQNYDFLIENKEEFEKEINYNEEDKKVFDLMKRWEKNFRSKNSKLRTNKNFNFCIKIMENNYDKFNKLAEKVNLGVPNCVLSKILSLNKNSISKAKPIIIVPDEILSGNLNLLNATEFLKNGKYNEIEIFKADKNTQEIQLEIMNKKISFEIWDDINYLKNKNRLNQVVAIFIKGSPYQFRNVESVWKCKNIAQLFKKIRGYYLNYSNKLINKNVKEWNVKILHLDKNARHKDSLVYLNFLEDFKRFLLSSNE